MSRNMHTKFFSPCILFKSQHKSDTRPEMFRKISCKLECFSPGSHGNNSPKQHNFVTLHLSLDLKFFNSCGSCVEQKKLAVYHKIFQARYTGTAFEVSFKIHTRGVYKIKTLNRREWDVFTLEEHPTSTYNVC